MSLTIDDGTKKIMLDAREGETIADAARRGGVFMPMPCGGRGRCGKCAVMTRGDFSPPGDAEALLLAMAPSRDGYVTRAACLCAASDGEVVIPGGAREVSVAGLTGELPEYDGGDSRSYGVAIDIGTTTISALLYEFPSGKIAASAHEMNRQAVYGADVLSRIDYSNNNGIGELQACITSQLAGMIAAMLRGAGAVDGEVTRIVAAGNTTMLHFLTGLDPRGIGAAPFTPESLFGVAMPAAEIWPRFAGAELYLPPSVSAYVGADIICGILSTGMTEGSAVRMLIDVGTNGEMALWDGSRLVCCSTAAGPAFEGASISMGMPAVSGAISRVAAGRGVISAVVIDGAPPAGICGSGMISAIDVMLREGVLNGSGKLLETGHGYESFVRRPGGELAFVLGESGVYLTQRDIRNIQLVKASIAAGASVLMKSSGVDPGEIDALYLSGGFGSSMDPGEAAGIGLIPAEASGRARAAGNTALSGAAALLFSRAMRDRAGEIASIAEEISLSQSPEFMDEYVERMPFRD